MVIPKRYQEVVSISLCGSYRGYLAYEPARSFRRDVEQCQAVKLAFDVKVCHFDVQMILLVATDIPSKNCCENYLISLKLYCGNN